MKLSVYGSVTCEDTALVRAQLRALHIPFADFNREHDAGVNELLARYNNGNLVTPTLVFGDDQFVLTEPSPEQLHETLRAAGFGFQAPRAVELRGELKNARLPNFALPATNGDRVTLYNLRGRKRAVLFFVDAANDRISQGYARQLTHPRALFDEYNALPVPIVRAHLDATQQWAHEFARGYAALSDADGSVKQKYAAALGIAATDVLLVILDSFCAPRAYSHGGDAGELIAPGEITSWLRLIDCECDE